MVLEELKNGKVICPHCGSENISFHISTANDGHWMRLTGFCEHCNAIINEVNNVSREDFVKVRTAIDKYLG